MSDILVNVIDQTLIITNRPVIAANGVKEDHVVFTFDSTWNGYSKVATFYNSPEEEPYKSIVDINGRAVIPWEVTAEKDKMYFGVVGTYNDIVRTSEVLGYDITKGAKTDGQESEPPTPGIYEQMLQAIEQLKTMVGSPLTASTAAAMTDTNKIYVYTGSESGMTNGNWYFWNGSAWVSGGTYNAYALVTDTTLTHSGEAADSKTVGDRLAEIPTGTYDEMTVGNAKQLLSKVFIEDQVPYNFRTSGGNNDIGDRLYDKIVGGSIAWNQLLNESEFLAQLPGVTPTLTNHRIVASGTMTAGGNYYLLQRINQNAPTIIVGHKYYFGGITKHTGLICNLYNGTNVQTIFPMDSTKTATIINALYGGKSNLYFNRGVMGDIDLDCVPQFTDLTAAFGSAIADYIYSLEQQSAGAGVALFKTLFPKYYYPHNAGELMHVQTSAHNTIGFNAYDNSAGTAKVVGGMQYQITGTYTGLTLDGVTITPDASGYFTPTNTGVLTVTGGNATDTCVHLVWDGERDGEYEPYVKHSYALDSDLVLRGILKLDANNNLYYDGDIYEADGTVTRRYGIVDLGACNWVTSSTTNVFYTSSVQKAYGNYNIFSTKYPTTNAALIADMEDHTIKGNAGNRTVYIKDSTYNSLWVADDVAAFKTAMSGVYLVYEKLTPTPETADPFTELQVVDDFGTEEYVDERTVPIPVGHDTRYLNNLRAKIEMVPDSPDGDGDYIVRQTNGENAYVPYTDGGRITTLEARVPAPPTANGTYKLTVTITDGTPVFTWTNV